MLEDHPMSETALKQQLAERFREVNGHHPMTDADDAYVSTQFVSLEELCAVRGRDSEAVRRLMLGQRLPLPGYVRSDGAEMVPADLFALADEAGGLDQLEAWFTAHWADPITGKAEWNAYLSGQYVPALRDPGRHSAQGLPDDCDQCRSKRAGCWFGAAAAHLDR